MNRDFGFKLNGLQFKSSAALFDLIIQAFQLHVQWSEKITNLMDLFTYLVEMIFHSSIDLYNGAISSPSS